MRGWIKEPEPVTDFEMFCHWYDFKPRCKQEELLREQHLEPLFRAVCLADVERRGQA